LHSPYELAFLALWVGWALYWRLKSRDVKANAWRESVPSRLMHIVPLCVAAFLLLFTQPIPALNARVWPQSETTFWTGWLLAAGGLSFTVWARRHLAANWSGTVTLKENHELITGGPYELVRHPIYTGLLLGFAGSAVAVGEWRGILAVALVAVALWRKLRIEERGMRQLFGESYELYARRVRALIPYIL
jgi:protein-S-isoprenylcysteine O-methyltransferase Ste14